MGDIRDNVPPVQILGGTYPPCPIGIDAPATSAHVHLLNSAAFYVECSD